MKRFKNILVVYDFQVGAEEVLERARDLALANRGAVDGRGSRAAGSRRCDDLSLTAKRYDFETGCATAG